MSNTIYVVNGPNLDMLGVREREIYGKETLNDVRVLCEKTAAKYGYVVQFTQHNGEGELIDTLHKAFTQAAGVVINAGAYTHYSYAIADAVKMLPCPVIELHISNVFAREPFRAVSVLSPVVTGVVAGLGVNGYAVAVQALIEAIDG